MFVRRTQGSAPTSTGTILSMSESRFLKMDSRIEEQLWHDFHPNMIVSIQSWLMPLLLPKYAAQIEERVCVNGAETTQRERYIAVVSLPNRELVTVIELLSPANKRVGADGRREYLRRREQILQSAVHLVEIDLLLKGERLPTVEPLPEADFYAFVSRSEYRPAVEVYHWRRDERMPTIPIPLLREDGAVLLDLQAVYEETYTRAKYEARLALKHVRHLIPAAQPEFANGIPPHPSPLVY